MVGYLTERAVDSPSLCADVLLVHALKCERLHLYTDPDRPATDGELTVLRDLVRRAAAGEPVQYLVGTWSFYGCEIAVDRSTLIPRPCTETLVELALASFRSARAGSSEPATIIDLCTGTGCIAIALAKSLRSASPQPRILATELSEAAASLARCNVERNGVSATVEVLQGDLDAPLEGRGLEKSCEMICANPPYISDSEWREVPRNVRDFEPESALRGGADGLGVVRRLMSAAHRWLRSGGCLLVEIAASQGEAALQLATEAGLVESTVVKDLEGHDRVLRARQP